MLLEEYLVRLPVYPLHSSLNLARLLCDEHKLVQRLKFVSLSICSTCASENTAAST